MEGEEQPETPSGEELESDDETLSFSNLLLTDSALEECDSQRKYVQSPCGSPQRHFEFSRSNSQCQEQHQNSSEMCPADDLFYNGRLLPLSSSVRCQSQEPREPQGRGFKPCGEQVNFSARDYRHCSSTASLDSQCSSYWESNAASSRRSRSSSGFSDSADGNAIFASINSGRSPDSRDQNCIPPLKTESIPSTKHPVPATNSRPKLSCKTSIKWQFFTLGLIKIPEMRLDDIRLRSSYGGIDRTTRLANPMPVADDGLHRLDKLWPNTPNVTAQKTAGLPAMENAPAADNNNNNLENVLRNQNVPSDSKGWRILRSIVSYRIGCRDSCGVDTVSAPRKLNKCISSNSNGDNRNIMQHRSGEIFHPA